MKKTDCLFTLWVAAVCAGGGAYAVGAAPAFISNYGEIQSVKNYSSNPFWNKNSPYNQNFPKPIYATGADLNTGDCNRVVENLVTAYCTEHNYCANLRISDVRPAIIVQLSQLPGHNFATSCGGYIDSTFEKFQKAYGNVSTVSPTNSGTQTQNTQIANPFVQKQTAGQKAVAERTAELERLQSMTTPAANISATAFPKTTADLSFTDRIANTTAGYEQYKDMPSYKKPDFKGEDENFFNRLKAQNSEKYCERQPNSDECKKLREHNITYNMLGSSTKCKPDTYETGKGATVSCIPQRKNSDFLGWCTDFETATTYDGKACPMQHTIAKTDTDDKIYYAKWACYTDKKYIQTQNECRDPTTEEEDPNDPGTGCPANAAHRDPTTCQCYESDFMNSDDCECRGKSTWDATKKKCVCPITDTSNLDIPSLAYVQTMCQCPSIKPNFDSTTHRCEDGTPASSKRYIVWNCLAKPTNTASLRLLRKDGHSGLSKWSTYCRTKVSDIDDCIGIYSRKTGIVTDLFRSEIRDILFGHAGGGELKTAPNATSYAERIELTEPEMEKFIAQIKSNISDISAKCTSSHGRDWWLLFDELPESGYSGNTDLKSTKAICIGGDASDDTACTPGAIETY